MKIHLISFADGNDSIVEAGHRLQLQAIDSKWFNTINIFNLEKIKVLDDSWFSKHHSFINSNKRGFGYWIWKSKIIELSLNSFDYNDIIVYMDVGCEINNYGKIIFDRYIQNALRTGLFCFYLNGSNYTTRQWTKSKLMNKLTPFENELFDLQPQIEATFLIVKNTFESKSFIERWQNISIEDNYIYSNDICDTDESDHFIENRHDQAIFSLLLYNSNYGSTIRNENYFPDLWRLNKHPVYAPIAAFRNLSGVQRIKSMQFI